MNEAIEAALRWRAAEKRSVLATLVRVEGSGPRDPGATIAVCETGEIAGSISSGCIESDVVERAERVLRTERSELVTYGPAGPFSLDVGLTCGGAVEVLVAPFPAASSEGGRAYAAAAAALRGGSPVVVSLALDPSRGISLVRAFGGNGMPIGVDGDAGDLLVDGARRLAAGGGTAIVVSHDGRHFLQAFGVRPEMIVFGAVDFARAVATIGKFLGYEVTVVDARARFATAERLPDADRVVVAWPDEYLQGRRVGSETAVVVLTHDERFDVPLLAVALESEAGYVGVMGNRATHARRLAALRGLGIAEERLARMHAPIGLDLGARTPEAVAISIAAEILATRAGRSGGSLRASALPVRGSSLAAV